MAGIITPRGILGILNNQEKFTVNKFLENLVSEQRKQLVAEKEINQQQKRQLALNKCCLDSILLGITDIVLTVAPDQHSPSVVSENLGNLDLSKYHLVQQSIKQFWQPETSQTFFAQAQQAIKNQQRIDFEYSISVPDQEQFWFSAQISPLPDNTAIWVARDITKSKVAEIECKTAKTKLEVEDITQRKRVELALQEKEAENKSILLKEIHHRIKNNLQIVSSLLDLQSDQIQDPSAIVLLEKSQARIHTMALIYEKLYTSKNLAQIDFREYVNSLIRYLHDSFIQDFQQVSLDIDIKQMYLDLDLAIPCGLIINELVVNSLEHAFHNQVSGEIKVSFHKYARNYQLTIQDNGSGNALEIARIGDDSGFLGLSLVNCLVKDQLKGVLKFEQNNGFVIQITLPLI